VDLLTYFYLYVILDIFSRYVVGWMVAHGESAQLAHALIGATCAKQTIAPGTLTIHADRGSSMKSQPVALLLADLGVTKTHSRPHVSDDHPFSESQFKTFKYRPDFPERFGSIADARAFCRPFFGWFTLVQIGFRAGITWTASEPVTQEDWSLAWISTDRNSPKISAHCASVSRRQAKRHPVPPGHLEGARCPPRAWLIIFVH